MALMLDPHRAASSRVARDQYGKLCVVYGSKPNANDVCLVVDTPTLRAQARFVHRTKLRWACADCVDRWEQGVRVASSCWACNQLREGKVGP